MPGTVHIKVVKARDLPVMDKRSELTDAFVEVKHICTCMCTTCMVLLYETLSL